MDSIEISLSLPRDLIGALDVPQSGLPKLVKESFAIDMFRQNRISSGKAAELLGVTKLEFIQLLGRHGVSYFTQDPQELENELTQARQQLNKPA